MSVSCDNITRTPTPASLPDKRVAADRLSVCFVCNTSPQANGGTAAYERSICDALSASCDVHAIARLIEAPKSNDGYAHSDGPGKLDHGSFGTTLIGPSSLFRPVLWHMLRLITRPWLQPVGVWLYDGAFKTQLSAAMPGDVNVVHFIGTGWEMFGYPALREARRRDAIFVVTPFVHPGIWGDSGHDIKFYNLADVIFVASQYEANHLIAKGLDARRVRLTGLAPACPAAGNGERFRTKHQLGNRPLALFIARRQRYKGYHVLREAMAEVLVKVPDACLVVIGPDSEPPYPALPDSAVLDLGTLSWSAADQQEKSDALAAADVYAMPSEAEAFGIVYVEAWSFGKPVIGGPAPAVLELIQDGVNGFHVDQSKAKVAQALGTLLQDRALSGRMGAAGLKIQRERYNWNAITQNHLAIYRQIMSGSRS